MTDVAYALLTVVVFAAIAVVARRLGDGGATPQPSPRDEGRES
ncbi:hypothetical protein [Xylanimonas sp. McL0601]